MKVRYGFGYVGSKSEICDYIIPYFPRAENFYDLFGGGFAMTHAMMLRRKNHYKKFIYNEIRKDVVDFLKDILSGKFNSKNFKIKWVSREEFNNKKHKDFFIENIWSYGYNESTYLYEKKRERFAKSVHNAIVFNEFDDIAKYFLYFFGFDSFNNNFNEKERLNFFRRLTANNKKISESKNKFNFDFYISTKFPLVQLERINRLKRLYNLGPYDKLEILNKSFEEIEIKDNSVIYCDPPYFNTIKPKNVLKEYKLNFNKKRFLDWADEQKNQ